MTFSQRLDAGTRAKLRICHGTTGQELVGGGKQGCRMGDLDRFVTFLNKTAEVVCDLERFVRERTDQAAEMELVQDNKDALRSGATIPI